jgi:hypothetical protein
VGSGRFSGRADNTGASHPASGKWTSGDFSSTTWVNKRLSRDLCRKIHRRFIAIRSIAPKNPRRGDAPPIVECLRAGAGELRCGVPRGLTRFYGLNFTTVVLEVWGKGRAITCSEAHPMVAETSVAIGSSVRFFLAKANCGSGGRSKKGSKKTTPPSQFIGDSSARALLTARGRIRALREREPG